jgi:hypothetical protein
MCKQANSWKDLSLSGRPCRAPSSLPLTMSDDWLSICDLPDLIHVPPEPHRYIPDILALQRIGDGLPEGPFCTWWLEVMRVNICLFCKLLPHLNGIIGIGGARTESIPECKH